MKKRVICVLAALITALSAASCGENSESETAAVQTAAQTASSSSATTSISTPSETQPQSTTETTTTTEASTTTKATTTTEATTSKATSDSSVSSTPNAVPKVYEFRPSDDKGVITCVSISTSTSLDQIYDVFVSKTRHAICYEVAGMAGTTQEIDTELDLKDAAITFTVDQTKLGNTKFEELMFMWYDESNDNFVELLTDHDKTASTVSAKFEHAGNYLITDARIWWSVWERNPKTVDDFVKYYTKQK